MGWTAVATAPPAAATKAEIIPENGTDRHDEHDRRSCGMLRGASDFLAGKCERRLDLMQVMCSRGDACYSRPLSFRVQPHAHLPPVVFLMENSCKLKFCA